ncbi:hypothetical protein JD969_07160 [Planctomycetota bacterium]|nr:hypothetical protein JD969_07160 [Planctomycetota bacterium]
MFSSLRKFSGLLVVSGFCASSLFAGDMTVTKEFDQTYAIACSESLFNLDAFPWNSCYDVDTYTLKVPIGTFNDPNKTLKNVTVEYKDAKIDAYALWNWGLIGMSPVQVPNESWSHLTIRFGNYSKGMKTGLYFEEEGSTMKQHEYKYSLLKGTLGSHDNVSSFSFDADGTLNAEVEVKLDIGASLGIWAEGNHFLQGYNNTRVTGKIVVTYDYE